MRVFFTVSKSGLPELLPNCQKIMEELKKQGATVIATFDRSYWKGTPWPEATPDFVYSENEHRYAHDLATKRAISLSDAMVIEATHSSFRLGFGAFFALSLKKPVLVLSQTRNYGHLIDQPNLFGAKYTLFTLPDEIEKFLRHVRGNKLRNRFNLFISDAQKKHLEEAARRYGVSMSDYLRKLIETDQS